MSTGKRKGIYEKCIKRLLDLILGGAALIILSPILLITALLVRIKLGSPVFFKQARPGKDEKIFHLVKFRSMTNAVDKDGKLLPDSQRLTKFGKILRKSSLDELPELINIVKGDMSIVGPRPLSIYYLPHYEGGAKRRHDVRPGLTGLAQVNGRNTLGWDDRFAYDEKYVDHVSFLNDFRIILSTAGKVVKASGISVRGTAKVYDYGVYKRIQEEGENAVLNYDMTYSEIGSYFWKNRDSVPSEDGEIGFLPQVNDSVFTFSGRTAIEIALKDAMKNRNIKKAYVPSYCCVSMLQSFLDNGVTYDFYDVTMENGKIRYSIDPARNCDLFLYMRYFGMESIGLDEAVQAMKNKGCVMLEDITHSLFGEKNYYSQSDYLVASLRKWFEIPTGGWAGKTNGTFAVRPDQASNDTVLEKLDGMDMKARFIAGEKVDKETFLAVNAKFDNDLIHVDRMLKLDDYSHSILAAQDMKAVSERRRTNAKILKEQLKDMDVIALPDIDLDKEVPLFYPVFLKEEDRNSLRKTLIQAGIYCPVHWPEVMGAKVGIRENELSLICDQRYSEKDMLAISRCIHDWYNKK